MPAPRKHLAALDGLRFVAAFCVLIAHGYGYVVTQGSAALQGPVALMLESLAVPGMTLFFVLSGFVIHLNYSGTATKDWAGTFEFFIARFSRLYPLFLAVFAFDFWRMLSVENYFGGRPMLNFDLFGPLPVYLSFTQTWLPIAHDGHLLFTHYGWLTSAAQATGAMWSLSLEFLFYLIYPWMGVLVSRLRGARLVGAAVIVSLISIVYYMWCSRHTATLFDFGVRLLGAEEPAREFQAWAGFYSPLGRMAEFLLGAFAAQQYLLSPKGSSILARWPATSTTVVAAAFAGLFVALVLMHSPLGLFIGLCTASLVALLMLLAVRHSTWISRALSGAVIVSLGESSYSLYLLHWYTLTQWVGPYATPLSFVGRIVVFLVGIAATLAIARLVYVFYERPSLRWLRRNFKPLRLHLVLGVAFIVSTAFSLAASMQVHSVWYFCQSASAVDCSALGIARAPGGR